MALWPVAGASQVATNGAIASSFPYVTVTASATPHTMGAWATLIASTGFASDEVTLAAYQATAASAVDTSMLVDIGVGAAGSERVLVAGVPIGWAPAGIRSLVLPIRVPSGVRLCARIQSAVVSATLSAGVTIAGGGAWRRIAGGDTSDSYGVVSGASSGTALADVGSANTKAAWTEITSGTNRRHRFLIPFPALPAGDSVIVGALYLYDIGIGASGSEVAILPNLGASSSTAEELRQPVVQPYLCNLPAGTRLSARMQKSGATAEPLSMVIVGID